MIWNSYFFKSLSEKEESSLRPNHPAADINPADAARFDIKQDDDIRLINPKYSVLVKILVGGSRSSDKSFRENACFFVSLSYTSYFKCVIVVDIVLPIYYN